MVLFVTIALFVATAGVVLLAGVVFAIRFRRARLEAREKRLADEYRPRLLELLAEDEPNIDELLGIGRKGERDTMDVLAYQLMTKLRGQDREILSRLLTERGAFETARRRTRKSSAAGRARAAEMLGACDPETAVADLARLLEDRDQHVRSAAARSIGKLGKASSIPPLMEGLGCGRLPMSVVGMAILHLGPSCGVHLRQSLRSEIRIERMLAAECLGLFGDAEAVSDLIEVAGDDSDVEVRCAATKAIGQIGAPQALESLVDCVSGSGPPKLRAEAAIALGRLGSTSAVPILRNALHEHHAPVVQAAAIALGQLGPSGARVLFAAAQSEGSEALHALEALDLAALRTSRGRRIA